MLNSEKAVGNYLNSFNHQIDSDRRKGMIILMEDINKKRRYRLETFYMGVNIADHYLMKLAIEDQ